MHMHAECAWDALARIGWLHSIDGRVFLLQQHSCMCMLGVPCIQMHAVKCTGVRQ